MDILNKIVESMNKEQVRYFKLFLSRSHDREGRMDKMLFDYMRKSGEKYDEKKIVSQLYSGTNKNSFYRLRNRLLRDLNKSLMIQHFDDDESVYPHYLLALEKFYMSRNKIKIAHYFLKKAEEQLKKTENYEMLDIIYSDYIRLSHEMPSVNPENYIKLRSENQERIRQLRDIDDILAVVSHKMKMTQNFSSDENPVLSLLQKTVKKYPLKDSSAPLRDLAYWLEKSITERISAVQQLRNQHHGNRARLQRVARITQLSSR